MTLTVTRRELLVCKEKWKLNYPRTRDQNPQTCWLRYDCFSYASFARPPLDIPLLQFNVGQFCTLIELPLGCKPQNCDSTFKRGRGGDWDYTVLNVRITAIDNSVSRVLSTIATLSLQFSTQEYRYVGCYIEKNSVYQHSLHLTFIRWLCRSLSGTIAGLMRVIACP